MMITGQCLDPISLTMIQSLGRAKLPDGKVVNMYRGRQVNSANKWNFYYYRGKRFYISQQDYVNSIDMRGVK